MPKPENKPEPVAKPDPLPPGAILGKLKVTGPRYVYFPVGFMPAGTMVAVNADMVAAVMGAPHATESTLYLAGVPETITVAMSLDTVVTALEEPEEDDLDADFDEPTPAA